MNYDNNFGFPSWNHDGVFCVSSGGVCRFSGHKLATSVPCFAQGVSPGSDPYNSCTSSPPDTFFIGTILGYFFIPITMILLGYLITTRGIVKN